MTESIIERLFEHNNWANQQLMDDCIQLSDHQLDSQPVFAAYGSIRQALIHLVSAQVGYLRLLTRPVEERQRDKIILTFAELADAVRTSGEGLLELIRKGEIPVKRLETTDGFWADPWVVLVQVIDHAAEHRQQICGQLSDMGLMPPALDGWVYGEALDALVPK
jgi:uncharacterized damage-inducible protein DinB